MRCPSCGAQNADDARTCTACGASLIGGPTEEEIDELLGELPTVAAERAQEEQTRLIAEQTALLVDEASSDLDEPTLGDVMAGADEDVDRTQLAPEPTVVRPRPDASSLPLPDNDKHFVVRNTRDYDHDAQSTNRVKSVENFETLHQERSRRGLRRDPYARSAKRGTVPGEGNSRSKLRPLLAMFLVALILAGGAAVLTYGMELWGGKTVPSLAGSSQQNAEIMLQERGLVATFEAEPADDAIGKVLSQDPAAGTRVPEGSEVLVVIATNRTIPDVVGMTEADARAALEDAGAERITTVSKPSSQTEGTVISVSPEQGKPFVSRNEIQLTVAGPYTVPDVIGKKETDAVDALKAAGLNADVTYVSSEETVRTVVATSPSAGEIIAEGGTVTVQVSSPFPSSPMHVAEFFDHSSQDIDTYLQKEGYSFEGGVIDNLGNAVARYASGDKGTITFSSQPQQHNLSIPEEGSSNVLSTGAPIAGVRFEVPASLLTGGTDRIAVEAIAGDCGLEGLDDICDSLTMKVAPGSPGITVSFTSASGKMGDLVWSVLVLGDAKASRGIVTCAKQGIYPSSDLATFHGSLCQYMAYNNVFAVPEYQVQEEKKDDKKDEKSDKDDKKDEGQTDDQTAPEGESEQAEGEQEATDGQ